MTSLERMSHLVDRDIYSSSVPHASTSVAMFQSWQAVSSFLFALSELQNPNSKHGTTQPKT